jgi:hypothetical protein
MSLLSNGVVTGIPHPQKVKQDDDWMTEMGCKSILKLTTCTGLVTEGRVTGKNSCLYEVPLLEKLQKESRVFGLSHRGKPKKSKLRMEGHMKIVFYYVCWQILIHPSGAVE